MAPHYPNALLAAAAAALVAGCGPSAAAPGADPARRVAAWGTDSVYAVRDPETGATIYFSQRGGLAVLPSAAHVPPPK